MIRILGAITGSALALATLLVVIGIPQFKTEGTATERAVVTLPLPTTPVDPDGARANAPAEDSGVDAPGREVSGPVADAAGPPSSPDDAASDTGPAAPLPPRETGNADDLRDAVATQPLELQAALATPQSWYAFWSPFRSELAANGFVAQLQSVTGLDYRVVRVKPGVYEVAFAYDSDDEITAHLTSINAATGLELPR